MKALDALAVAYRTGQAPGPSAVVSAAQTLSGG